MLCVFSVVSFNRLPDLETSKKQFSYRSGEKKGFQPVPATVLASTLFDEEVAPGYKLQDRRTKKNKQKKTQLYIN